MLTVEEKQQLDLNAKLDSCIFFAECANHPQLTRLLHEIKTDLKEVFEATQKGGQNSGSQ